MMRGHAQGGMDGKYLFICRLGALFFSFKYDLSVNSEAYDKQWGGHVNLGKRVSALF
jgi:hypothetical protein